MASNTFWLVWNPKRSVPAIRHPTQESARVEAERLARIQPGDEFFVLSAESVSRVVSVVTERLDYPF